MTKLHKNIHFANIYDISLLFDNISTYILQNLCDSFKNLRTTRITIISDDVALYIATIYYTNQILSIPTLNIQIFKYSNKNTIFNVLEPYSLQKKFILPIKQCYHKNTNANTKFFNVHMHYQQSPLESKYPCVCCHVRRYLYYIDLTCNAVKSIIIITSNKCVIKYWLKSNCIIVKIKLIAITFQIPIF